MTYCNTLADPLIKKIEVEKKTLDQIAKELCGNTVKRPRLKAIRIIKELLGKEYLIEHAESLGYNADKSVRQKSTSTEAVKRKIVSENDKPSEKATAHSDSSRKADNSNSAPIINISCCQKSKSDASNDAVSEKTGSCRQENDADTSDDCQESEEEEAVSTDFDELVKEIKMLIERFSLDNVKRALEIAESDG